MTKEIERAGIPIVHVTNLTQISKGLGSNRVLQGNSVVHVLGDPSLPPENELNYRESMVKQALSLLETDPSQLSQA